MVLPRINRPSASSVRLFTAMSGIPGARFPADMCRTSPEASNR